MSNKTQLLNHNERLASVIQTLQGKSVPGGTSVETCTVTVNIAASPSIETICYLEVSSDGSVSTVEKNVGTTSTTITCVRGSFFIFKLSKAIGMVDISVMNCERLNADWINLPGYAFSLSKNAETAHIEIAENEPT